MKGTHPGARPAIDPAGLLDVATMFVVTGAAAAVVLSPQEYVLPIFATIMIFGGGFLALYARRLGLPQQRPLSVWDVSGGLVLLGFCAAILSDEQKILQLFSL